ncbi:Dirigent protein 21 [Abeliophyllum distichum]|uniref:Dirigent protein n=1 Tax=Abeliophyllum distichum TaxID=126358 RepID=A0ABD1P853_9LAMI
MEKLVAILILFSLVIAIPRVHAQGSDPEKIWFQNICQGKEIVTRLHFYIQDALGGPNATVWEVSKSIITSISPTSFGQVRVLDDLITVGPDRNSSKLGWAQGLITFADMKESALNMNINLVFTAGKYNGSTLCILGRNPILNKNRELPVVGGTGVFRMARGYSISNTYSYDSVLNYGVLEYTVYVAHVHNSTLAIV